MSFPSHNTHPSAAAQSNISIDFNDPPIGLEQSWLEDSKECFEAHTLLKSLIIDQINQIPVANFNLVLQQCRNRASQRVSMHANREIEILKQDIEKLVQENQRINKMLLHEMKLRQQYYNELQLLKGAIRIFVRVRPLLQHEVQQGDFSVVRFSKNSQQLLFFPKVPSQEMAPPESEKITKQNYRQFQFDRIIGPNIHQRQLYDEEISPLTKSVLDGYNVSIFAYGQTGTGKTFTMQGSGEEIGIQQYILQDLYHQKQKDQSLCEMSIALSCLEIYNETCIDLLRSSDNKLDLKMDPQTKKIIAQGLREVVCNDVQEAIQCLVFAQKNRAVASTLQNHRSSRSHLIVQIGITKTFYQSETTLMQEDEDDSNQPINGMTNNNNTITSTMYLIDLAGSEKINTSSASNPITDSETKHINKSLSALGNVMESLRNRSAKPNMNGQAQHVPYRDTKLTYFMSNVFRDKHAIVCMIPHIAPSQMCFNESLRTLQFAERMSGIALTVNQ
ncbi:hypothetical protein C9374_000674 [Naegleria lovaniensis]|uniref:Kinesin-like protein n=1 Tax=Naegleria lovaniensis TaxID=51637 RepID=A0AA88KM35_NAELO|nr:uncharacterized protein C9374_000674 [Naegleria lovaniensis]KAG2388510.1 hypothetical protein C9374_000674 [Naegleria lovaniensis]